MDDFKKYIKDDFSWKNILNTIQLIKSVIPNLTFNEAKLFDEFRYYLKPIY